MFNESSAKANYLLRAPAMRAKLCVHDIEVVSRVESGMQTPSDAKEFDSIVARVGRA